jgi:hypothetical protein
MPFRPKDLEAQGVPISFERPGEVTVRVGPCSGQSLKAKKIPLDGRRYICAGAIFLKNGSKLQANFEIQTHSLDFLDRESVQCLVGDTWYGIDEPELWAALGISRKDALPYRWLPDVPLDYHDPGPYPMNWDSKE